MGMNTTETTANKVSLTEAAARQVEYLLSKESDAEGKGLRVFVERGGCSGKEYGMRFDQAQADDHVSKEHGVTVIVDPESCHYLGGTTIDFKDDINDSGFKITNPNARESCGCGKSFEV